MQSMAMRRNDTVEAIIGGIGAAAFPALAGKAVARALGFDHSAVIVHFPNRRPGLLHDDFDALGGREGLANYLAATHRLNPMIAAGLDQAYRARDFATRDFAIRPEDFDGALLAPDPSEELGFRTEGWPRGLEEVGVVFGALGGRVELSCYRARGRRPAPLAVLKTLRGPLLAAFRRHGELTGTPGAGALTPREQEVLELVLMGCGSEAIALRLGIGRYTVKDHRKRIFRKLAVGSIAELFARVRAH
jgi:DNA-binding CsgD family transcriptional regulator